MEWSGLHLPEFGVARNTTSNPARIQVQIMKSNGTGIELEVEGHDISCTCALIPEETIIFHLPNFCEKSSFVNNTLCTTAAAGASS